MKKKPPCTCMGCQIERRFKEIKLPPPELIGDLFGEGDRDPQLHRDLKYFFKGRYFMVYDSRQKMIRFASWKKRKKK